MIKGTVSGNSSDPRCKDGNARFTTVPMKAFSIKYELDIFLKMFIFIRKFFAKVTCNFLLFE